MSILDPRFTAAIPISARLPAPFTPKSLDPARLRRDQEAALDRDSDAIDKDAAQWDYALDASAPDLEEARQRLNAGLEAIKQRREKNAEHRNNLEKAHAELAKRVVKSPVFMLRVPTPLDRDQLQSRLIEMGANAIGQEQLRATMIEALFHQDWGDGQPGWDAAQNEAQATEHADFLDGLWQVEEAHNAAMRDWQEQEAERILDVWHGAPEREGDHKPRRLISVRDGAKQVLLIDRMQKTPMMRRIMSKQVDYERRHKMVLVRLNLITVTDIPGYSAPALVQQGLWDEVEIEGMRQAMEDAYGAELGQLAWEELVDRISRAYVLDGFEEKNSDSPPGNTIDQSSSVEPSGASESSDGTSTDSSSSPTPADGYETIIESAYGSGSASGMPTAAPSDGPTAGG